jgi:hypothetical protein
LGRQSNFVALREHSAMENALYGLKTVFSDHQVVFWNCRFFAAFRIDLKRGAGLVQG